MEIEKLEFYFDQICTEYTRTQDFTGASDGKESACNAGDQGLIPWRRGCSCLENSIDREVREVAKSQYTPE